MPSVDTQQSYTLLSLNESDGQTSMTFQRSIQSCDDQDFDITVRHPDIISHILALTTDAKYSVVCLLFELVKFHFLIRMNKL